MKTIMAVLVSTIFLQGCATIVSKSNYPVSIDSVPRGASVVVTNYQGTVRFTGTTPAFTVLPAFAGYFKKARYTLTFEKEGYAKKVTLLDAELDQWYIGNMCVGALPGFLLIDPLSGNMWRLREDAFAKMESLHP